MIIRPENSLEEETMKPGRGRPKDLARRQKIIQAARQLFLEHGVEPVSMDGIAQVAGVSKRTIYSHFADKKTLFQEIFTAEAEDYQPQPPKQIPKTIQALRRYLIEFGLSLMNLLIRPGIVDLGRLMMNESKRHPDLAAHFYNWGPQPVLQLLTDQLQQATKEGLVTIPDCALAADQLLSMCQGYRYFQQQLGLVEPPTQKQLQQHISKCVDMFLRAYTT